MLCSEIQGYPRNAEINTWYVFAKTGRGTESPPKRLRKHLSLGKLLADESGWSGQLALFILGHWGRVQENLAGIFGPEF